MAKRGASEEISMMNVCALKRPLEQPSVAGVAALLCTFAAVALPTIIRCLVDNHVTGIAFSPYLPFVLLTAVFVGWKHAALAALISAAVADLLFIDPRFEPLAGPTDAFGILIFLLCATLIITLVQATRLALQGRPTTKRGDGQTGIIFSLESWQAWASWAGSGCPVRLGPESEVAEMMHDFLAQLELGKRLNGGRLP